MHLGHLLVKDFFEIDESFKSWVMRSASKKWRAFKCIVKKKYYDANLSVKDNIAKGCKDRIPPRQWAWLCKHWRSPNYLAISNKNKATRKNQENGTHVAGSRSFAVFQRQLSIKYGREVGRTELFVATHTNKEGKPVNAYCAKKIADIDKEVDACPTQDDEQLYMRMFPKAKTNYLYGLGLAVGGKPSEQPNRAIVALEDSRAENLHLQKIVESLLAQSQKMSEDYNEIKEMLAASQKQQHTQGEMQVPVNQATQPTKGEMQVPVNQATQPTKGEMQVPVNQPTQLKKPKKKRSIEESQRSDHVEKSNVDVTESQIKLIKEIKKEKVCEYNAEQANVEMPASRNIKSKKFKTPRLKEKEEHLKRGMEVCLKSPNSAQVVALGTIQNANKEAKGMDGIPLCDYVEVLINIVLKDSTILPRAQGRVSNMGSAQAKCIAWPRKNVTISDGTSHTSKITRAGSNMSQSKVNSCEGFRNCKCWSKCYINIGGSWCKPNCILVLC